MNTRRTTRNKVTVTPKSKSPKRKHDTETDTDSDSSDGNNTSVVTVIPKKNINKESNEKSTKRKHESENDGSSSDSSVGDYLKNPDEIDLNSSFFTTSTTSKITEKPPDFITIEKKIFGGVQHLSDDSDSDESESEFLNNRSEVEIPVKTQTETGKINFSQLREYNKKIEEAKACVQKYESSKKVAKKSSENITKLLKLGETKNEPQTSSNSIESDFVDSDDDENEMEWQEIEVKDKIEDKISIPKDGVQITVELPQTIRKKSKGVDMMTAIKRRINRVKKENQVYVHKVHLLCWIAHGNYINSILNDTELLAPALSLLPSDKCYPPKHADMSYLELIVKWYGKIIKVIPKKQDISIKEGLQKAIGNKTACCNRDFVLIFIIILRSLGLQCRLVLSLQCLPLRPPASELCSLSSKEKQSGEANKPTSSKSSNNSKTSKSSNNSKTSKSSNNSKTSKSAPKSKSANPLNKSINQSKNKKPERKKSTKSIDKPKTEEKKTTKSAKKVTKVLKISQVDGADDEETSKKRARPSIRIKLNKNLNDSTSSTTELSIINNKNKKLLDVEDEDFKPKRRSPNSRSPKDMNGNKKSNTIKTKSPRKSVTSPLSSTSTSTSELKKKSKSSPSNPNTRSAKTLSEKLQLNKIKVEETSPKKSNIEETKSPRKSDASSSSLKKTSSRLNKSPKPSTSTPNNSPAKKLSEKLQLNKIKIEKSSPGSSSYFKDKKHDVTKDIINLIKGDMSQKRIAEQRLKVKSKINKENPDYDSDYFPDEDEPIPEKPVKKRRSNNYNSEDEFKFKVNTNVKRNMKGKQEIDSRVISSDDEASSSQDSETKKKIGNDVWVEVFLEEEEKWISVDLIKGQIHCVSELHSRASQPVSYIIAWNNDLSLKDVTARYCPNWNTVTRKLRVDNVWWQQALRPFLGVKNARDKEEDEDLARQQLDKPLPTTIGEYKNHPLYALKRHLLKFEGIYPPNAVTLGFIRNEAVYARECVHTLHSREIWVKHAKVVKPAQEPYKIVKARPKYDKLTGNMITDLPLELFGSWQVEDYVPPTAENGVVPRNAFGNVELFKACMLPKKTVHLQLPGLNKICRKLRIDCAPAVVGFDFHSGFSHPMFDGYVVCEEFKDTVIEAWEQDQIETAKKEQEKYEKRVWGNWRKLIKAALIRERLKARYDFGSVESSSSTTTKGKGKKSKGTKVFKKLKTANKSDDEWTDVE